MSGIGGRGWEWPERTQGWESERRRAEPPRGARTPPWYIDSPQSCRQSVLRPVGVHCSGTPESSRLARERTPSARRRLTRVRQASCLLLWRDERRPSISRGQRAGAKRVPARIGGRSRLPAGVGSRSAGGNACGFYRKFSGRRQRGVCHPPEQDHWSPGASVRREPFWHGPGV